MDDANRRCLVTPIPFFSFKLYRRAGYVEVLLIEEIVRVHKDVFTTRLGSDKAETANFVETQYLANSHRTYPNA
ncbi:MAG: hypothetical protein QOE58_735 [Actinomycetota bacterium]|nr:hypothetical protein [Actinomycetota bacterium]